MAHEFISRRVQIVYLLPIDKEFPLYLLELFEVVEYPLYFKVEKGEGNAMFAIVYFRKFVIEAFNPN